MRKKLGSFKNMMIWSGTILAVLTLGASVFTISIWPIRTQWAMIAAFEWIALVCYANGFFDFEEV